MIHLSHHDNSKKIQVAEGDGMSISLAFSQNKGYCWSTCNTVLLRKICHEHTALVTFLFIVQSAGHVTLCYEDGTKWFEVELTI